MQKSCSNIMDDRLIKGVSMMTWFIKNVNYIILFHYTGMPSHPAPNSTVMNIHTKALSITVLATKPQKRSFFYLFCFLSNTQDAFESFLVRQLI